ncbi:hypothetical protein [Janthinobacterium sp. PAMC25594]|uniref:hypothetical protein n=1 Tax=Janthinobacterium sp. PAMC25594 TaxID=2861284 RepID=UPI001C630E63|nr:hypothetical protein [Janthinobacterium sp. PAMC25594]QYG05636.1 hypothetical protein KY494_20295 [Janthinobacterium sp. PAMC25594]
MQKEYPFNQPSLIEQLPLKSKSKRKIMPTNVPHYLILDNQDTLKVLPIPAYKYITGDKRTQDDLVSIATKFRYAVKNALENGLGQKFIKFSGVMRIDFKKVTNPNISMITFIKDLRVIFIPDWISDDINDDNDPFQPYKNGLIVIDQYGDSVETKGGIAYVDEPFATCLKNIADMIYEITLTICDQYKQWIKSEHKISNVNEILSTDQMYQTLEYLLLQVTKIAPRIKQLIEDE